MPFRLTAFLVGFLPLLLASRVDACTIPVFRYALDRWPADPFHIVVPTSWSRAPGNEEATALLRAEAVANLELKEVSGEQVPQIHFPREMAHALKLADWSSAGIRSLLDSPVRQELARRILAGESVVWVMVESGDAEADKAFAARLEKRLAYLINVASLPAQDPNDPESKLGPGPPLQLKFSVLRVSKSEPAEQPLIHMLAGPEGAKFLEGTEPFAAPVFGRGRVLGAWTASELDDTAIEDTSLFLIGRCSCRVKNENPGWDILLKVDWDKALEASTQVASTSTEPPSMEERVADLERYIATAAAATPPQPNYSIRPTADGVEVAVPQYGLVLMTSWLGVGAICAVVTGLIWFIVVLMRK